MHVHHTTGCGPGQPAELACTPQPTATRDRQAVVTSPADLFVLQPVVPGKTKYRSPDKSLIDAKGFERCDEAAQPHGTSMRRNRITEYADKQRTRANRPTLPELPDQLFRGRTEAAP